MCDHNICIAIQTNTFLEALLVIISPDYSYIWLDRIINQSQPDTL